MKYVVEIEDDKGIRRLYGPVASMTEGSDLAESYLSQESVVRTMVKQLYSPPLLFRIHPNQTTIQDHIPDIHDAGLDIHG